MEKNNALLVDVIEKAVKVPGVKVSRDALLMKVFEEESNERKTEIIEKGPIEAGYDQKELKRRAKKLVNERTLESSAVSFATGLPGGIALVGTIPADVMQFFGKALKLAQELTYLYGDKDIWNDEDKISKDSINRLILYLGVMFGVSGATATLKVTSSIMAEQALKKLPQKALTQTVYYPIIKKVLTSLGIRVNKGIFAKGVAKAIPIAGGFVSGGLTLVSMRPMGMRLVDALDDMTFDYGEEDFEMDLEEATNIIGADSRAEMANIVDIEDFEEVDEKADEEGTRAGEGRDNERNDLTSRISEAKNLLDEQLITEEEFTEIKRKIIESL